MANGRYTKLEVLKLERWKKQGAKYILPIKMDGTELEGLLPTIGYVPIETGIDRIGQMLIDKLGKR